MSRFLLVALLAVPAPFVSAEEYGVVVRLRDDVPVAVPFFRCARNAEIVSTEEIPEGCKERETERWFSVTAARITNLGTSIIWIHIGKAKLPVLPGKVYRRVASGGSAFSRVFLSGEPGGVAHVFASNPVQDEPEITPPKGDRER